FLEICRTAKGAACGGVCVGRREACRELALDFAIEVIPQLFVELGLHRAAADERARANTEAMDPGAEHRGAHSVRRIRPSAPANRSHDSRSTSSCLRPAAVSA